MMLNIDFVIRLLVAGILGAIDVYKRQVDESGNPLYPVQD